MNKSAILLANGLGSRLMPITAKCHKSLLPINGVPNLIQIVDNLIGRDISVFIAANYDYREDFKKALGTRLNDKNVHIKFVKNSNKYNNCYTMKKILNFYKSKLSTSYYIYVIDCDNYITDYLLFEYRTYCRSGFFTVNKESLNNYEWSLESDRYGFITNVKRFSLSGDIISGVSIIHYNDFSLLRKTLSKNKDMKLYWEDIFIDLILKGNIRARNYVISNYSIEYDNISSLISNKLMTTKEIASIIDDNNNPTRLNSMTNCTYKVVINGEDKVLRLPGDNTDFIDKNNEINLTNKLLELYGDKVTPSVKFYDEGKVKLSDYLEGYITWSDINADMKLLPSIIGNIKRIHSVLSSNISRVDLLKEISYYESNFDYENIVDMEVRSYIIKYLRIHSYDSEVIVHRDMIPNNIMVNVKDGNTKLIDMEYSGKLSLYWDLGCLASEMSLLLDYENFDYYKLVLYITKISKYYFNGNSDKSTINNI